MMFQSLYLKCAELNVCLQFPENWYITDTKIASLFQACSGNINVKIQFFETDSIPEIIGKLIFKDEVQCVFQSLKNICCYCGNYTIAESVDEIRKKTLYCRQIRLSEKQNHIAEVLCSSNAGKKHTVRSLLVWGGLPHILADFRRVILHSSFLAYKGKAILFTAPSGTGKSTQAELWRVHRPGAEIVNGDRSVLSCDGGQPYAHGIPLCGTSGITKNRSMPVRAIIVLRQGPENRIRRLGAREAFTMLFSECSVALWSREDTGTVTDLLTGIISSVPVYLYACRPDASAVDDLEAALDLAQ